MGDTRDLVNTAINEVLEVSGDRRVVVGTAIEAITALPAERLHAAIVAKIEDVKRTMSVLNALDMTEDELDRLAANILVTRDAGGKSTGGVRIYFSQPQAYTVPRGASFRTDGGLRFFVVAPVTISESSMQLNVEGGRFFLDVPLVEAEGSGDQYNVEAGKITAFSAGGQAVVGVRNLVAFSGGRQKETNAELLIRMQEAVTTRDLVIRRAIYTLVRATFPEVKNVYSSGYGDPEMQMDERFGVHVGGEVAVYVDSGRADTFATVLTGFSSDLQLDASGVIAQVGFIRDGILQESSKRKTEAYTFAGAPAELQLTGDAPDTLDSIDPDMILVVRQNIVEAPGTFPVTPVVGGSFNIDHAGRSISDLVIISATDGTRYFCNRDFSFNAVTGAVTRLDSAMHTQVLVSYSWIAVLGVDYTADAETGVITAVDGGLLEAGDEVSVTFSYFRVGRRDDTLYTVRDTPVRRIKSVEVLDADDNVILELMFVPPSENGTENGWSWADTVAQAPASSPWWTLRVLPYKDVDPLDFSDRDRLLDKQEFFVDYEGITDLSGFSSTERVPWPRHGTFRYSIHEEIALYFVNPSTPYDGTTRIRVTVEVPKSVRIVQGYIADPERRVLCAGQWAKCFVPAFVNISLYGLVGDEDQVVEAVEEFIDSLAPGAPLRVSEIASVILDKTKGGATYVVTPFNMNVTLHCPSGKVQEISSTGQILIEDALDIIDVDLAEREFVSARNVKFYPGVIEVKS